ncbi:PhnA domain-containing protein [Aquimarina brevivitae]|uniref:Protein PhnA n=1 Tax=Aquimarina brevivitae TaxID=323412 RepID=A0A4Q7P2U9_9FLAO|nr:alkylphosphonate utilization protein [Aquimarina brevivitae]RZS93678.1 protein PhnA [Aquimarina brevivitae]
MDNYLTERSNSCCELCSKPEELIVYNVPESPNVGFDAQIVICSTCEKQINNPENLDPNHWRCLNDSMWSQVPGVQVTAWRMLHKLKDEGWPQDLLDMLYLDEETLTWAKATNDHQDDKDAIKHLDTNGARLTAGDNVVLIKDLDVKGTSFVAKRGTAVRNISLVYDNAEHIEGKVNGQQIVILTKYVKKS